MNFTPTQEQLAIRNWVESGTGNLVVEALAGCTKTSTAVYCFPFAPERKMLYAVFNKKNQVEAQAKIKDPRVEVRTLHSVGFMFIKKVWPMVRPEGDVEQDRVEAALFGKGAESQDFSNCLRLVGFLKNMTINPTFQEAYTIAEKEDLVGFGQAVDDMVVSGALSVLQMSRTKDKLGRISFDDMVWLPCAMNWVKPTYDMVVIDEAQDMNLPQLTMARQASKGRVMVIGDSRQAIYGFRGAVQGAMSMMKITLRAKTLGLNTTFRCCKKVVGLVNTECAIPQYQAASTNSDGKIESIGKEAAVKAVKVGDAILSRLNAPLVPLALQILRNRIPARIEGRELAKQFLTMVNSFKANSVPRFIEAVEGWTEKQRQRVMKQKNADKKIEAIEDTAQTLLAIAEGAKNVEEIRQRVDELFQDTKDGSKPCVILSSVHKAKGLEWDRVFLLSETFRKEKGGEEANIYYVAITRARHELFLVGGQASKPIEPAVAGKQTAASGAITPVAQIPPTKLSTKVDNRPDTFCLPHGHVFHKPGNVVMHRGGEWVCVKVSDCNAKFMSLGTTSVDVKFTDDDGNEQVKTITKKSRAVTDFTNNHHPGDEIVVRTMSPAELEEFLQGKRPAKADGESKQQGQEKETAMSNKAKKQNGSAKKDRPSYAGRSQYIHSLRAAGKTKTEVREVIDKKYPGTSGSKVFDEMWDSYSPAGTKPAKASAKPAKGKSSPPARKPAKQAAAAAPKPPVGGPPPRPTPPPAETPAPAEPAGTDSSQT